MRTPDAKGAFRPKREPGTPFEVPGGSGRVNSNPEGVAI